MGAKLNPLADTKSIFYLFIAVIVALGFTFMGWTHNEFGASLSFKYIIVKIFFVTIFAIAWFIGELLGLLISGVFAGTSWEYIATKSVMFISYLGGTYLTLWMYDNLISALIHAFIGSKLKVKPKKGNKGGGYDINDISDLFG